VEFIGKRIEGEKGMEGVEIGGVDGKERVEG